MTVPPELVCPGCLGALLPTDDRLPLPGVHCERCDQHYRADQGFLDFIDQDTSGASGIGPRLMHSRVLASVYEQLWRPTFITLASGHAPDYAAELEQVLTALAPAEGGVVVDLSCGPGFTGRHLAHTGRFARVYGLDWSVPMLRRALSAADPQLPLVRADVAHLPFARGAVAGVHAGAALHMWPDPDAAIAEAARVLRIGGVLVASTFAYPDAPLLRPLAAAFQAISSARVFEVEELAGTCRVHGLRDFQAHRRGALILFSATRG
jgi:SAM-dependent methyltransferase